MSGRGLLAAAMVAIGSSSGAWAAINISNTVGEADIGRATVTAQALGFSGYGFTDVLLGSFSQDATGVPPYSYTTAASATGKAFASVTTDLSTDHQLLLTIQAPAGQQFRLHSADGQDVLVNFVLEYNNGTPQGVDLVPGSAVSVSFDGVAAAVTPDSSGVNSDGDGFLAEGRTMAADGLAFQTMTIGLDYSVRNDGLGSPLTLTSGLETLSSTDRAYVTFGSGMSANVTNPAPAFSVVTLEAVPEPASVATLALGGLLMLRRRRR